MAAYTKNEAIAEVQQGLGFRSDKATEIERALRNAQSLCEEGQTLPWWLLSDTTTLTGTASTETVPLPAGFLRFDDEEDPLYYDASVGRTSTFTIVPESELRRLRVDPGSGAVRSGAARWGALRKLSLLVGPVPDVAFEIRGSWYARDVDIGTLTGVETNLWLTYGPQIVIGMAGMKIAADLEYPQAAEKFQAIYAMANARMISDAELRKSRAYRVGAEA